MKIKLAALSIMTATMFGSIIAFAAEPQLPPATQSINTAQAIVVVDRGSASVITKPLNLVASTQKPSYAVGEAIKFNVQTNKDAYIYVFNIDAAGKAIMLLPNSKDQYHYVKANTSVILPRQNSTTPEMVADQAKQEKILVVASTQRLNLNQVLSQNVGQYQAGKSEALINTFNSKAIVLADPKPNTTANVETAQAELIIPIYAATGIAPQPITSAPIVTSGINTAINTNAKRVSTLISTNRQTYRDADLVEVTYGSTAKGTLHLAQVDKQGKIQIIKKQRISSNLLQEYVRVSSNVTQLVAWLASSAQDNLDGASVTQLPADTAAINLTVTP